MVFQSTTSIFGWIELKSRIVLELGTLHYHRLYEKYLDYVLQAESVRSRNVNKEVLKTSHLSKHILNSPKTNLPLLSPH